MDAFNPSLGFDAAALEAAATHDAALCTLVGIEGAFSRDVGAQMAVCGEAAIAGDMTGGCLEAALISETRAALAAGKPRLVRYGKGSPYLDIRLPCGGGVDCFIDPAPDRRVLAEAAEILRQRQPVALSFGTRDSLPRYTLEPVPDYPTGGFHGERFVRLFRPQPRILLFGTGPEMDAVARLAEIHGCKTGLFCPAGRNEPSGRSPIFLGKAPDGLKVDPWTAIILLFHEHEWEVPLLQWALSTNAFHIGALGGAKTVEARRAALLTAGVSAAHIDRIHGPVGLIPHAKDARTLGLSILSEVIGCYERSGGTGSKRATA